MKAYRENSITIPAGMKDVYLRSAINAGQGRYTLRNRLSDLWVDFTLAHPIVAGCVKFTVSRLTLAFIGWAISGSLLPVLGHALPWFGKFLAAECLLLKWLFKGVSYILHIVCPFFDAEKISKFLLTNIKPDYMNLMRIYILNFFLSLRGSVRAIKHKLISVMNYKVRGEDGEVIGELRRRGQPSLGIEDFLEEDILRRGPGLNNSLLKAAYRSGLMFTEVDAGIKSLLEKKLADESEDERGYEKPIRAVLLGQGLTPIAAALYFINTIPFANKIAARLFQIKPDTTAGYFLKYLGSLAASFWSSYLGMAIIGADK